VTTEPTDQAAETPISPVASLKVDALKVLANAVSTLYAEGGRPPTASEVRLEMKRQTYGGFDPKIIGFKRFRDFLSMAATEGHIRLDASRRGDLAVLLPGEKDRTTDWTQYIRPDLWRAFVDWDPRMLRFYDKEAGKAVMLPKEPAPFEPERFRKLRGQLSEDSGRFLEIRPVEMTMQLAWMREYAEKVADNSLRPLLLSALDQSKPLKFFVDVLRTAPTALRSWHRYLGIRVRAEVERWRDEVGAHDLIDIDRRSEDSKASLPSPIRTQLQDAEQMAAENIRRLLASRMRARNADSAAPQPSNDGIKGNGAELRSRLHAAIDRMPYSELRMLRIPVGYLFED
jgi:Uncharacterised protein family (UPF0158)